jgi:4-hydroxy-2-oxoheptanedioate aldolase
VNAKDLKKTLAEGKPVFGMMLSAMDGTRWGAVLASTTLDYLVIDTEHGSRDRKDVANLVNMLKAANLTAIVRVPEPNPVWVAMAMDAGADGVLVPYCEELDEVKACAYKLRTHPLKGKAFWDVVEKGEYPSEKSKAYLDKRHDGHIFILGIESKTAVERLETLLENAPVDGVFVGPNDMTTSLGIPDEVDNPVYLDTLKRVVKVSEAHGKPVMIHQQTRDTSLKAIEIGARWVLHSTDAGMLRNAVNADFSVLRESAGKRFGASVKAVATDKVEVV